MVLATALSEGGGRNPVSQALLTFLRPGDVVQLEIVQGRIEEPKEGGGQGAFNSFSGWLIGPTFDKDDNFNNLNSRGSCCCQNCSPHQLVPTVRPPYPAPSYAPPAPVISPPAPPPPPLPTARPPYILTTTTTPATSLYGGRTEDLNCCDSLLISTTSPNSPALLAQDEKFGVYRLQYVDRSPLGQGRATFKHIERDLFLYFVSDSQIDGWIVGPRPGVSLGGLFLRVSHHNFRSHNVLPLFFFFVRLFFVRVRPYASNMQMGKAKCGNILTKTYSLETIRCQFRVFKTDILTVSPSSCRWPLPPPSMIICYLIYLYAFSCLGRLPDNGIVIDGKTHYHHHEHFHYHDQQQPRAIKWNSLAPSYDLKGNSQFVEATFRFPNNSSFHDPITPQSSQVIEAKNVDGFVLT